MFARVQLCASSLSSGVANEVALTPELHGRQGEIITLSVTAYDFIFVPLRMSVIRFCYKPQRTSVGPTKALSFINLVREKCYIKRG